jgi:hypothetical protein
MSQTETKWIFQLLVVRRSSLEAEAAAVHVDRNRVSLRLRAQKVQELAPSWVPQHHLLIVFLGAAEAGLDDLHNGGVPHTKHIASTHCAPQHLGANICTVHNTLHMFSGDTVGSRRGPPHRCSPTLPRPSGRNPRWGGAGTSTWGCPSPRKARLAAWARKNKVQHHACCKNKPAQTHFC